MDSRARAYPGGAGYEFYDYTYDYGQGPTAFTENSWQTSYLTNPGNRATHSGLFRDASDGTFSSAGSSYDVPHHFKYGYSEPDVRYGSRREQRFLLPQQRAVTGNRGYPRGDFGASAVERGLSRPPPLFTPGQFPDLTEHQGLRAFKVNSCFGGGIKQQRRKWSRKFRSVQKTSLKDGGAPEKKQKTLTSTEDTDLKDTDTEAVCLDGETEVVGKSPKAGVDDKEGDAKELGRSVKDIEETVSDKKQQDPQNRHIRDKMLERIQFVCSLCKFRTFYDDEMNNHLQSDFHKEHLRYVRSKLYTQKADFLEEYATQKRKKTRESRQVIPDLNSTIQKIYRDHDLTQGLGMEHFVKKVEAAHCAACDMFIPMHSTTLQRHLKSPLHNQNCRNMMEQSKKCALAVARSILNNKLMNEKLDRYIKGENPFTEDRKENISGSNVAEMSASHKEGGALASSAPVMEADCSLEEDNTLEAPGDIVAKSHQLEVPQSTLEEESMLDSFAVTLSQENICEATKEVDVNASDEP
ncbi:A-kinase anchor protein 8-like [Pelobates fuscus]|uniref:A-kinase anchor protein 8-like n=1 Tax=Pelobates fuscus TaxID=191477 RepID=UPI002FE4BC27